MIRVRHGIATAGVAVIAVGILASTWADEPLPPKGPPTSAPRRVEYPPDATDAQKNEIDLHRFRGLTGDAEMRTKLLAAFPFESLEERLQFDAPGRKRLSKSLPTAELELDQWQPFLHSGPAKIPPAALATLLVEDRLKRDNPFDRLHALAALHKVEVQKFITSPGFGISRIAPWAYDRAKEKPPADWSESDRGDEVKLPATGDFFTAGPDKKSPTLPSSVALASFHTLAASEFARPDSLGLVKDKTQVAGFLPHTLNVIPDGNTRRRFDKENLTKDKDGRVTGYTLVERWAIRKTELIGLLVQDTPVAYMTPDNQMPTMAGIKDTKTRELSDFESSGLKDLAAGKEVVVVDATTNQVRMVGAIRMSAACMKCHDGKRGDLLGAFSYELVRVPAYVK